MCETWCKLSKEFDNILDGFTYFDKVRVKNPQTILNSGGVSDDFVNLITRVCADWDDCIVLHCTFSSLYDVNDIILYFLYVSPERSTVYDNVSEPNGILQMQDKFHELKYMYPSAHVVIAGDLNARTKDLIDYIRNDDIFYVFVGDVDYTADSFDMSRNNKDCYRFNNFGKTLTDFCRFTRYAYHERSALR